MEENDILKGLNNEQKAAVQKVDGPVLIVAGAGSGKTRVLTSRIAYMIEKGVEPGAIMALTFTKKAAGEMKERIASLVGPRKARPIFMGTFHSIFIRFLRKYSGSIGYPESFTIYDTSDSNSAMKVCIKELNLDEKVYKPKVVLSRISMAKNNLVTAKAYKNNVAAVQNDASHKLPHIADLYDLYDRKCRESGVMDFDDILLNMNILLRDNPEALKEISAQFTHVLVDEYQDTNYSQYVILKRLCSGHRNICVVGDDSQSIYAFRGAKIENILNFQKDFPESRIFRLEQNYRSTQTIVDAANSLIARNEGRIPKKCFSEGAEGDKIHLIKAYTDKEEADLIVSSIKRRIERERAEYKDFAILYRTNSQSRVLEEYLRRRNMPYMIYSGASFFERAEVRDLMAYFKLAANPADNEAFKRAINKPARGIGDTSIAALDAAAHKLGQPLLTAALSDVPLEFGMKMPALQKIRKFCNLIMDFHLRLPSEDAYKIALGLATLSVGTELPLLQSFKADDSIEGQSRAANVEELLNGVKSYVNDRNHEYIDDLMVDGTITDGDEIAEEDCPVVTLGEYLENVSLLSSVDVEGEDDGNKIALMTVHSSKGLEFPYVFVAGLEENLFPSGGWLASLADIEEERRLFYVAITRAQKAVELSFAENRMRNGKTEQNEPSRFVREIDPKYIENPLSDARAGSFSGLRLSFSGDFAGTSPRGATSFSTGSRLGGGASSSTGTRLGGASNFSTGSRPGYSGGARQGYSGSAGAGSRPGGAASSSGVAGIVRKPLRPAPAQTIADKDFFPTPVHELRPGMTVLHKRFGRGVIRSMTGTAGAGDAKATILFDHHGERTLMLSYAPLMKME
ncbi:MAG: UvrD-helicase domain-containing protein [Bacteroidales bacterium]|nr:UvrD-helicase domain-containing protein [Bacteroidales bacterium]